MIIVGCERNVANPRSISEGVLRDNPVSQMLSKFVVKRGKYNKMRTCGASVGITDGEAMSSLMGDNAAAWTLASDTTVSGKYEILMRDPPFVAADGAHDRLRTLDRQPDLNRLRFPQSERPKANIACSGRLHCARLLE